MWRRWLWILYGVAGLLLLTNSYTNFELESITRSQLLILALLNKIPRMVALWLLARYSGRNWLTLFIFATLFFSDMVVLTFNSTSSNGIMPSTFDSPEVMDELASVDSVDSGEGQLGLARWFATIVYNAIVGILITLGFVIKRMQYVKRALSREKKMLKGILNALPVAVGVYNDDDEVLLINKLAYDILGEDINTEQSDFDKEKDYRDLLQTNLEWKQFKSWMLSKIRDKETDEGVALINEAMPNREGKRLFDIQAEILPIERSNVAIAEQEDTLLMVVNDVTERETLIKDLRQAQQVAEQSNRAKSRFLANVSHELRTPITSIVGFSQLIGVREDIHDEVVDLMGIITRSGENLLELVNDILDLSKAEANRLTLVETMVEPRAMLFDEINLLRHNIDAKGLEIELLLSYDVQHKLCFDETKVRQILRNLLSNAFKFTDEGTITVTMWSSDILTWEGEQMGVLRVPEVQAQLQQKVRDAHLHLSEAEDIVVVSSENENEAEEQDSSLTLHFEISDTGQGIAVEELEDIFEPFMQSRSGIGNAQSTGLGLAICKQYANFLGGDMTIQSQENVGTRCHFWFKAERENARKRSSGASSEISSEGTAEN